MMVFLHMMLSVVLSMTLMGCVVQNKIKKSAGLLKEPALFSSAQKISCNGPSWHINQVQFLDIPLPLHAIQENELPSSAVCGQEQYGSFYVPMITPEELYDFFIYQMECCGWRYVQGVRAQEQYVSFEKPYRWCSLVIGNYKKGSRLTIFTNDSV